MIRILRRDDRSFRSRFCFRRAFAVLSHGDCSQGALGHARGLLSDSYEPSPVERLPGNVVKIASGHYHSFAISSDGELWSWGRNTEGQLGRGISQSWGQPERVQGLEDVNVQEATGSGVVSMAIDACGQLWSWGKSKRGQLGLGVGKMESLSPQLIQTLIGQQVMQVSLGWGHALACTKSGDLYSWGYPANGRLGYRLNNLSLQETSESFVVESLSNETAAWDQVSHQVEEELKAELSISLQWEPRVVDIGGLKAIGVACGFDHSMVLCDNGLVLSFGDNCYGQLGRSTRNDDIAREGILTIRHKVAFINAGLGHSLAIANKPMDDTQGDSKNPSNNSNRDKQGYTAKGENYAYSWGWNSASQLGRGSSSNEPMIIPGLEGKDLLAIDGGRVHSLAVTLEGELWTWGSGKNGRLGLGSFADETEPCLVESLQESKVHQAVCGMDHTVILVS